tara:strand:+ start:1525 stop:1812 length:288 start_codon:yes stop_codon:yes gene_type:complete
MYPVILLEKKLPNPILNKIQLYLTNDIALEAAFYKVWLGDTDPCKIRSEDMVFPEFWGQAYLSGPKQIEVFGYLQTDNIYTFEEMFKIAKKKYKY